jgi:hypothetical protein
MGGVPSPDSVLDTVPRVGDTTIKGKYGVVIVKDRDDDNIGETLLDNALMPSDMGGHKHVKYVIPLHACSVEATAGLEDFAHG